MKKETYQVGVIGAGGVAVSMIEAIHLHPRTKLATICDVNRERAQQMAEAHQVPYYVDTQELLTQELDLVYLAVPPKFHHAIALDILRNGTSILCEKPLANSFSEAVEMSEAAERTNVVSAMHFPTYYATALRQLWSHLREGQIGTLQRVEVMARFPHWPRLHQQNPWIAGREQGGFVREVFPHYIHLIQRLLGPVTTEFSRLRFPEDPEACETDFLASLSLQDGTPVVFHAHRNVSIEEEIAFTLYGDAGTLQLKNWRELWIGGKHESLRPVQLEITNNRLACLSQVVLALDGENADICDFVHGREVQEILEQLLKQ